MKAPRWLANATFWLLGALALFGLAAARVAYDGRTEMVASDAASATGDTDAAIAHARRAAASYLPWASHVASAYRKLRDLATDAELRGDPDAALFAWQSIRSASIGSRWLDTPRSRERAIADAAIARLSVASRPGAAAMRKERTEERVRAHAALLAAEGPPNRGTSLLLLAGAALFVVGGRRLTARAWDAQGRLKIVEVKTAACLAAAGMAAWLVGLLMA